MAQIKVGPLTVGQCAPRDVQPTRFQKRTTTGSSQYVGVSHDRKSGRWVAAISRNGVTVSKGFRTETEAHEQRLAWELEFDGPMAGATPANRARYTHDNKVRVNAVCPDGVVRMCQQANPTPIVAIPFQAVTWAYNATITGYLTRCNGYWYFVVDTQLMHANIFDQSNTERTPQRKRIASTTGEVTQ